jgi:hypothetical protein
MAMKEPTKTETALENPHWPATLPDSGMRVAYGKIPDELVVRFSPERYHDMVVVAPIATPDLDYAGMLVADDTSEVLGIHVYPLAAFAVKRHPSWRALMEAEPSAEAVLQIVKDIRALYERYGLDPDDENPD